MKTDAPVVGGVTDTIVTAIVLVIVIVLIGKGEFFAAGVGICLYLLHGGWLIWKYHHKHLESSWGNS